jgi:tRNA 2-selenouridine synthase
MQVLNPEHFIKESRKTPVVDVRSPAEYDEGHIPGAVNIPLFDDRERAVVGTLYVNRGRQTAIETGLEIIGPKMAEITRNAAKIAVSGKLLVHCWRGGMRSESMAWLYERIGIQCSVLEGGYKAYRNFLLRETGNIPELIVIDGPTGSGKTEILLSLKAMGEQVIDLEWLACHRGSVFGGIGKKSQPTTQQFQNNLFEELLKLNRSERIWIEGESRSIGKVYLPDTFWNRMKESVLIEINVHRDERAKRLVSEYGMLPKDEMEYAIAGLAKRIGDVRKNEILTNYHEGNLELTAFKLLDYYDKIYNHSKLKYKRKGLDILLPGGDALENAGILLKKIILQTPKVFDNYEPK